MARDRLGEWVLSLAMEPSQARAVVGDLVESGSGRGAGWFWSNVLGTLGGTVWSDLRSQPLFLVGLAARGALLLCGFLVLVWCARGLAFGVLRSADGLAALARNPGEWLWPSVRLASLLATVQAGRWVALRSRGKDLAVCVAMALVYPFVYCGSTAVVLGVHALAVHRGVAMPPFGTFWYHWRDVGFVAVFLLGMALARAAGRPRAGRFEAREC